MYKFLLLILLPFYVIAQTDIQGSKDHKFLPRIEGFYIADYSNFINSTAKFIDPNTNEPVTINGEKTIITYKLKNGLKKGIFKKKDPNIVWELNPDTKNYHILPSPNAAFRDGVNKEYWYIIDYDHDTKADDTVRHARTWVYVNKTWKDSAYKEYTLTLVDEKRFATKLEDLKDLNTIGRVELYTIYFLTNQYKYEKESEPTINNIVDFLKKEKNMKITIEGAADTTGSKSYNLELSRKRATYIKDAIVNKGVDAKRLKVIGIGESMDKRDEDKVFELQLNRRTTLIRN